MEFTVSNVLGTHSLLEACRIYGKIKKFLHVSTDEVYGEVETGSADENYRLDPTNPYAATKAGAEFMVRAYNHSFKLPIVITRGNNVFGKHQYPDKVIPRFISQIRDGRKITIHGNGDAVRNFIHVDDVSSALDFILNKGVIGETYNIGSSDEVSVMELASTLIGIMKPGDDLANHTVHVKERTFNDSRYSVSSAKLRALGWEKKTNFEDGLKATIAWYLANTDYWAKDAYEYKE
jgi:dTDP-glucose 4,6-dehydratase